MKPPFLLSLSLSCFLFALTLPVGAAAPADAVLPRDHRLRPADVTEVRWAQGFWAEKVDLCRRAMLPSVEAALLDPRNSERLENFRIAAEGGQAAWSTDWSDGDCHKWIEALALTYATTRDAALDRKMDEWIAIIARAQQPDGYLSTNMQLKKRPPFAKPPKGYGGTYHELYNFGHLLTAACVHHRATGKENFLQVARKAADLLHTVLQPGAPALVVTAGNMPVIMGLVDLYRITGDRRYLATAQVVIDARGTIPGAGDLTQDHVPFRQETEAVGHAVFATYLYCGVADVFAETGETALWTALTRIWDSAALRRTYLTGGACALPNGKSARGDLVHEAFGADYQLPNRTAYNETCANIGNAMWNWRLLQLTGDARYADMMETVLYNSALSAVSADGRTFCYANPLAWNGENGWPTKHFTETRWSVHSCYCCPPQVVRTLAGLGRWAYSVSPDTVWVHLYGGNTLRTRLPDGAAVALTQTSRYPWDGQVRIAVEQSPSRPTTLQLRIPGWATGATLKVNGQPATGPQRPGTYAAVRRNWARGDVLELDLPMPARLIEAHPAVEDCHQRAAVRRGPVVYCLEIPKDQGAERVWQQGIALPENLRFQTRHAPEFLGGVTVLEGQALTHEGRERFRSRLVPTPARPTATADWAGVLYRPLAPRNMPAPAAGTFDVTLIPFFARANRGPALMDVWLPLAP